MQIKIPYGKRSICFEYEEKMFKVIKAQQVNGLRNMDKNITASFYAPIKSSPLNEFVNKHDKVLIVVSDATRYTGAEKIVPLLIKELMESGISKYQIEFIFSFGIHRPPTQAEIEAIIGTEAVNQFKIHFHDAFNENNFNYLGNTQRGTPVYINKKIFEFTKIIMISSTGFHYFAGFSGGRKSLIPGLASFATIKANHRLVLNKHNSGKDPNACIARLHNNPVHLDLMESIQKIPIPVFCINSIIFEKKLLHVVCGDINDSFITACHKYAAIASTHIDETREFVIASCGGYPRDINVIQSHKSLENASFFCKPGGVIIFIAHCRDGWGNKEFARWLKYNNKETYTNNLMTNYQINGQTAYSWKLKSWEHKIIMVSSIPSVYNNRLNVSLTNTLQDAYQKALQYLNQPFTGYIIPHAWEIIPSFKLDQTMFANTYDLTLKT